MYSMYIQQNIGYLQKDTNQVYKVLLYCITNRKKWMENCALFWGTKNLSQE